MFFFAEDGLIPDYVAVPVLFKLFFFHVSFPNDLSSMRPQRLLVETARSQPMRELLVDTR